MFDRWHYNGTMAMAVPGNGLCFLLLGGCFSVFITFLDNGLDLAVGTPKRF